MIFSLIGVQINERPLLVLSEGNVRLLQTKLIEPTPIADDKNETTL